MKQRPAEKLYKCNRGTTLVELVVCFALLGIFMSAASVVIANVTSIFYDVKGETYARQVSDIVLKKIAGEIEGAKINVDDTASYPVIYQTLADEKAGNRSGFKIDLYDRTDTHIQMYEKDGLLNIRYFSINPDLEVTDPDYDKLPKYDETIWTFDQNMYQGYKIKELRFVPANQGIAESGEGSDKTMEQQAGYAYSQDYPGNVIGIYLTLESPKYGEFYSYRYVRMYNIDEKSAKSFNVQLLTATKD